MKRRFAIGWGALFALAAGAAELPLPLRPENALGGAAVARRIDGLDRAAREEFVAAEILRGNVPDTWRRFVTVPVAGGTIEVAPDYLAVGSDEDRLLVPMTPGMAQKLAEALDCTLPTRKMVDAIWRAAAIKLEPSPIPPSDEMTSVKVIAAHSATVTAQRHAVAKELSPGALVAGHKKDVVITPRLAATPGRVAIYGWHRADGNPIQPLFTGHSADWVDYSHGVRLVRRGMTLDGRPTTIEAVLADDARWTVLSDEGPVIRPRYGAMQPRLPWAMGETWEALFFEPGIRVLVSRPVDFDATKPTRLLLYTLPAGNTIEQTVGRALAEGDDWHFDIQHIGAQTRWLRDRDRTANLVVAYLECAQKSWVLWRRAQADGNRRIVGLVQALAEKFPGARLTLAGHSAGGSFWFGWLEGVERIPAEVERIVFLDSNYAYDSAKGHGDKLATWLAGRGAPRLCVLAYEDFRARLDGQAFVSESGGTWGRSQAMLADLSQKFAFAERKEDEGLECHAALDRRIVFLLKRNPEQKVWHTRQVELNGFIASLLVGTSGEGDGYRYLGERVYGALVAPARP